jgi:hypothetical protein
MAKTNVIMHVNLHCNPHYVRYTSTKVARISTSIFTERRNLVLVLKANVHRYLDRYTSSSREKWRPLKASFSGQRSDDHTELILSNKQTFCDKYQQI